ncbi:MAG: DNA mismatch endonuclease Vsr [Desulfamplus sp.]|nr:DNA mismatch endonuclease Vsr [Desulfamplus sp.]
MTDVVDTKTRSRMMSGIRDKNTRPELLIRSQLHRRGFRFRLHDTKLSGKPDVVLSKYHAVIFVHGCFWHRHECYLFKWPKSRPEFWRKKINGNYNNDQKVMKNLLESGWRVCIVWECAIKGANKDISTIINTIADWLDGEERRLEISG